MIVTVFVFVCACVWRGSRGASSFTASQVGALFYLSCTEEGRDARAAARGGGVVVC